MKEGNNDDAEGLRERGQPQPPLEEPRLVRRRRCGEITEEGAEWTLPLSRVSQAVEAVAWSDAVPFEHYHEAERPLGSPPPVSSLGDLRTSGAAAAFQGRLSEALARRYRAMMSLSCAPTSSSSALSVPPSALHPRGAQVAATYVVPRGDDSARSSRQAPPTVPGGSSVPPCADAAPDGVGVSRPAHVSQQWLKAASGKRSRRIIVSLLQDDPCPPRHVDGGTFVTTSSSLPTRVGLVGAAVDAGRMIAQRRDASFALLQAGHWVRWAPACQGGTASGGGPPALTCLDALISTDLVVLGDLQPGATAECAKRSREDPACGLTSALIRPPGWQPSLFRHVRVLGPLPMGAHADHNAVTTTPMHSAGLREGRHHHGGPVALPIAPSCGDASNNTSSTAGSHIEGGMLDVDALLDALDGRDVCEGDQRYSPIHQRRPMSDHRLHHSDDGASAGPPPPPPSTVDNRIMSRRGLLASAKLFARRPPAAAPPALWPR